MLLLLPRTYKAVQEIAFDLKGWQNWQKLAALDKVIEAVHQDVSSTSRGIWGRLSARVVPKLIDEAALAASASRPPLWPQALLGATYGADDAVRAFPSHLELGRVWELWRKRFVEADEEGMMVHALAAIVVVVYIAARSGLHIAG